MIISSIATTLPPISRLRGALMSLGTRLGRFDWTKSQSFRMWGRLATACPLRPRVRQPPDARRAGGGVDPDHHPPAQPAQVPRGAVGGDAVPPGRDPQEPATYPDRAMAVARRADVD